MVLGSSRAALKVPPNAPKTFQDSPKRRQDGSKDPKMALRWAKETSRWPRDGPKRDHKGQNGCQNGLGKQNLQFPKNTIFPCVFQ